MDLDSFSFAAKIRAAETILVTDADAELDPTLPGDRFMLDGGARSAIGAPLLRGGLVAGALYFGKRRPNWFDGDDAEIARAVAAGVVLALQHQRLAEEQRRLEAVEGKARRLEARLESLRESLDERYGFDRIIGRSPALREALSRAAKVAPDRDDGADHRRERHRQGARRARDPPGERARRRAVRRRQLRGAPRGAARVGAVRPRARRLHRRAIARSPGGSSWRPAAPCSSTRSAR